MGNPITALMSRTRTQKESLSTFKRPFGSVTHLTWAGVWCIVLDVQSTVSLSGSSARIDEFIGLILLSSVQYIMLYPEHVNKQRNYHELVTMENV